MTPRLYQRMCIDRSRKFLRTAEPGEKLLWASPTGSGKTVCILAIMQSVPGGVVLCPSDDILIGFAEKLGLKAGKKTLEAMGYYTPIRYRNLQLKGVLPRPKYLIVDETHHAEAETYKLIDALCADAPAIGFTATPFRGTAKSTAAFKARWGEPTWLIDMPDAVKRGYISFPVCKVVPLLDDDVVSVVKGEFVVEELDAQCEGVIGRLLGELTRMYDGDTPDRPTMLTLPSVYSATLYVAELNRAGMPAVLVTGKTPRAERDEAFSKVLACEATLVQVNVVNEGVDLPLRRCVDLSPTMSPVNFLQGRLGRITRPVKPGEDPPEYVCTNRNLLRHAYLLEGLLPVSKYKEASEAFGSTPSSRRAVRVLGFEGLGKFTTTDIPLHGGVFGTMVAVSGVKDGVVTQYAAIASPTHSKVFYAKRVNLRQPDGTVYGRWVAVDEIPDLSEGYASLPASRLTPAQAKWWSNAARFYGLDKDATVNARQFAVLPIMKDTNQRFR